MNKVVLLSLIFMNRSSIMGMNDDKEVVSVAICLKKKQQTFEKWSRTCSLNMKGFSVFKFNTRDIKWNVDGKVGTKTFVINKALEFIPFSYEKDIIGLEKSLITLSIVSCCVGAYYALRSHFDRKLVYLGVTCLLTIFGYMSKKIYLQYTKDPRCFSPERFAQYKETIIIIDQEGNLYDLEFETET